MRHVAARAGVGFLLLVTACTPRWGLFRGSDQKDALGPPPKDVPTVAQLVSYLDENSHRLHCVRCEELDLSCKVGIKPMPALHGQMVCQQPRNFRLTAKIFGKDEVDLGSNQDEFWYWLRPGDPYQFHCDYKALEAGRVKQMPFPFQPDWLMDALGMGSYGPPERYQLVEKQDTLELVEKTRSPQGFPVRKVIVVRRRPVLMPKTGNVCPPQVIAFLLVDDRTGKEICSAHVEQSQLVRCATDAAKGAMIPKRIVLNWPGAPGSQHIQLAMTLDRVETRGDFPPGFPAFVRRPMQGVPSYDLAAGRPDGQPSSLLRAGYDNRGR
jgi:hypothetical protein